jgi:methionine transaminase
MYSYPALIHTKFPKVTTSIFTRMSQLAREEGALNLSQGFPEMQPPVELVKAVGNAIVSGYNQYAPMQGLLTLREQIAHKMEQLYSATYDPDTEITIVPGATIGIYAALASMLKPRDEVIIFEPAYDSYAPAIEANGAVPISIVLNYPDYKPDWKEVSKLCGPRTKAIIINSPHNPTGSIWTAQDMMKLEKLVKERDIFIVSDEVYEHIIFEGREHQSVSRFPGLANRAFVVFSFGKTYHVTGWKMGYVLAPKELTAEFRKIYQYMAFAANTPMQHAFVDIMQHPEYYLGIGDIFEQKRNVFLDGLRASRFKFKPSKGTYFQLLDYSKISDMKDEDFAIHLTKEHKIATIPVSSFYRKKNNVNLLRVCFAKSDESLQKAIEILCRI